VQETKKEKPKDEVFEIFHEFLSESIRVTVYLIDNSRYQKSKRAPIDKSVFTVSVYDTIQKI